MGPWKWKWGDPSQGWLQSRVLHRLKQKTTDGALEAEQEGLDRRVYTQSKAGVCEWGSR